MKTTQRLRIPKRKDRSEVASGRGIDAASMLDGFGAASSSQPPGHAERRIGINSRLRSCCRFAALGFFMALALPTMADDFSALCADRAAIERVYYQHRLGTKPPFEET